MPHYNSYDSFRTKKSIEKKQKIKSRKLKRLNDFDTFIIDNNKNNNCSIVIEVRYNDAYVLIDEEVVLAKLRNDINMVCNQVIFPGDKVVVLKDSSNYTITNIVKRKSMLSRIKKDSTRKDDIGLTKNIAANVDLAVIVVSAKEPPLHPKFIDRYLLILQNSNIPAIICLNKCDLKTDEEEILSIYKRLGITVIETSTYNSQGIDILKSYLLNKQAIFVGNSGVGKSSLTNAIMDDNDIKTSHISSKSKRGRHTTTTSKYYVWNENSSIIDTPGIRSLDVSTFKPIEIQDYFPELDNWKGKCKYGDCLHYHEPYESCFIKQGVVSGLINRERYESYLRIMSDALGEKSYDEIINSIFK